MKKYIGFIIILPLFVLSCNTTKQEGSNKVIIEAAEEHDLVHVTDDTLNTTKLQYFYYGIAGLDPKISKALLEQYDVKFVNANCALDTSDIKNNIKVDAVVKAQQGITVSDYIAKAKKGIKTGMLF